MDKAIILRLTLKRDFVASNKVFQAMVEKITNHAFENNLDTTRRDNQFHQ